MVKVLFLFECSILPMPESGSQQSEIRSRKSEAGRKYCLKEFVIYTRSNSEILKIRIYSYI